MPRLPPVTTLSGLRADGPSTTRRRLDRPFGLAQLGRNVDADREVVDRPLAPARGFRRDPDQIAPSTSAIRPSA